VPVSLSITPEKLQESYASVINPVRYGAIGDGTSHPISEWLIGGLHDRGYANLTEIQVDYPDATALTDESDRMAIMRAIRVARAQRDATGRADLITLPRGNFGTNGTITLGHQIRIKGQNPNSTKIIAFAGCDTLIRMDEGKSFYEHNQLIEGIYLEGNDIAEYGVIAQNLNENGGLRDVWISRYRNTGFKSEGATYTTTGGPLNFFLENVHILGSEAVGVDSGPGIHFAPGTSDRVSITNCLINPRSSTVAGSESILIESGGSMLATISSTHVEGAEVGIRVIRGQANIMSVTGHSLVDTVVVFDQRGSNDGYGVAHVINNAGSANALAFYEDGREDVKSTLRAAYYAASNGLSIVSTAQSAKVLDVRGGDSQSADIATFSISNRSDYGGFDSEGQPFDRRYNPGMKFKSRIDGDEFWIWQHTDSDQFYLTRTLDGDPKPSSPAGAALLRKARVAMPASYTPDASRYNQTNQRTGGANTTTLPNSLPAGYYTYFLQNDAAGVITFQAEAGATVNAGGSALTTNGNGAFVRAEVLRNPDNLSAEWILSGDLTGTGGGGGSLTITETPIASNTITIDLSTNRQTSATYDATGDVTFTVPASGQVDGNEYQFELLVDGLESILLSGDQNDYKLYN
ncbi:MAG: hypothetical protein AAF223_09990, partial [Bacteroidota bacterium]